jgi:hypothetical protein
MAEFGSEVVDHQDDQDGVERFGPVHAELEGTGGAAEREVTFCLLLFNCSAQRALSCVV